MDGNDPRQCVVEGDVAHALDGSLSRDHGEKKSNQPGRMFAAKQPRTGAEQAPEERA